MNKFEKILLTVFFIELFVGGGGRLIDFRVLSIRQVLFLLLILTFLFRIMKEKAYTNTVLNTFVRRDSITVGIYMLIGWFVVSAVIGYSNGNSPSYIVTDFLRVSFFAAYFPLAYYVSEERFTKKRIITIIKYCALAVAIFTILLAVLGKTIYSSDFEVFKQFWIRIMNDDLLFRRSHSVFYKSHFYVFVGLVLSINAVLSKQFSKVDIFNIPLCFISIFWSDTRGFFVALMVSVFMIVVIDVIAISDPVRGITNKIKTIWRSTQLVKKSVVLLVITFSVPFLYQYLTLERFEQSTNAANNGAVNDTSVGARIEFLKDSKDILLGNPVHFIFGKGYGTSIAGRINGIEMSFLDIWVEQGAIGLAIWLFLCAIVIYNYYRAYKQGKDIPTIDRSLIGVFVGVVLLTNINPFLNNPIGITFFILMLTFSNAIKEKAGWQLKS
ncbi:hypothetical protein RCG19_06030 [Neobacillus sp. OS1-2]|uniref:O-antigen ligase family protein n=1 Tax=Neobacillus sp. OS1-2 TaxID=3070680 RepID=UPI0027E0E760|nr:hypothetical protein [Neobacillus sp. OS1-2]WML41212.1 hypothetical protein RCG19_06030 [Neobacillus sp. OS1-2]